MSRVPDLERALTRAAERLDQQEADERAARRRRSWRLPLLVTLATLTMGGGAVAALDLLPSGDPVPVDADAPDVAVPQTARVLSLRAPDPDGGPPWGLWTYRERMGRSQIECFVPARVQDGVVGVVGRDGVFDDDGRFHPLQPRSSASKVCGSVAVGGVRWMVGDGPTVPASGYSGRPGPPVGGCRENVPASTMSRQTRRRLRNVAVCDRDGQRIVKYGFAGPKTVEVTYGNARWSRTIRPTEGESGAYLFVLRPKAAAGGGPLLLTAKHSDGTICIEARGQGPGGPGCAPPPGIPTG